jgi:hypothetical protein
MLTLKRLIHYIHLLKPFRQYLADNDFESEYTLNNLSYTPQSVCYRYDVNFYVYFGMYSVYVHVGCDCDGKDFDYCDPFISLTFYILDHSNTYKTTYKNTHKNTHKNIRRNVCVRYRRNQYFYYYIDIIIKGADIQTKTTQNFPVNLSFNLTKLIHKILNHFMPVNCNY